MRNVGPYARCCATSIVFVAAILHASHALSAPDRESAKQAETIVPPEQYTLFDQVRSWFTDDGKIREKAGESKSSFLVVPTLVVNPTVGFGGGASARYDFQLADTEDTSFSAIALTGVVTTKSQFKVGLTNMLYTQDDAFLILGRLAWEIFPRFTYGLGGESPESSVTAISMQQVRLQQTVWSEIFSNILIGVGFNFEVYYDVKDERAEAFEEEITELRSRDDPPTDEEIAEMKRNAAELGIDVDDFPSEAFREDLSDPNLSAEEMQEKYFLTVFQDYPHGTGTTSRTSGLMFGLRYDSRDNPRNAERGFLVSAQYGLNPTWLGSSSTWHSVLIDGRAYYRLPFNRRQVLACWAFGWMSFGDVLYFSLPATGEDFRGRSARAYYRGRYRGQHMLYGELEYRIDLWRWLGAVSFVNLHSVTEPDSKEFEHVIPGAGIGLRFLINRPAIMNIALDAGFGKDGAHGVYLNVNETF